MNTRLLGATLLLVCGAVIASPLVAQRSHFGPHVAYNFDIKEVVWTGCACPGSRVRNVSTAKPMQPFERSLRLTL